MIELVYNPSWFFGKGIIIDIISIFVLLLISFFSIKYYKINRKKNYLWLFTSFMMISFAFVFKIITNFTFHYTKTIARNIGHLTFTYSTSHLSYLPFYAGFFFYRLLMLFGLYVLFSIYTKQKKSSIFLVSYLLIITTYFGDSAYYLFHLTALIILCMITYIYFLNYRKTKLKANSLLYISFAIITVSQVVFIFVGIKNILYAIAEIIQLIGYVMLLFTLATVLIHGKKKK